MRIVKLAAAVLLLFALGGNGLMANGFENTGLGTTARGMGGAFRAIADDWSAAYYNPAGYAFIMDNELGGSLGLIHFRNEITPNFAATDNYGNKYGWGIANGQTIYNFHRILNNPSAGLVVRLPVWGETVFGLSVYQPFDNSLRWEMYALDAAGMRAYNPDAVQSKKIPGHHYLNDLDVVAFQFTASREFKEDKLSIGLGLQLLRGDLWHSHLNFQENPRGDADPRINDRPRDRIPRFIDSQGRGWGFGVRAGILWKATEKLNVAISGYLPFDITITGKTNNVVVMPKSDQLAAEPGLDPVDYKFVLGEILDYSSNFESELKLPSSISFGLAYQITEKLTVAFDAEYTRWAKYEGLAFSYSNFSGSTPDYETEFFTTDLSSPVVWKDAGKVSMGLRYKLHPTLTLLAGGGADQSPARESQEINPQFFDLGTKKNYNVGGILHINRWDVGIITSYFDHPDVDVAELTDVNDDNMFDNFPGAYKAETYETVVSLSYRF